MTRNDARGLALTAGRAASAEGYERALELFNGYYLDPLAEIDGVLGEDPEFLMGHALRAGLLLTSTERRAQGELGRSVGAAEALVQRGLGTERERRHVAAARSWYDGDFAGAVTHYNKIAMEWPRDLLALQLAHLGNFCLGRTSWLRDTVAQALPSYSTADRCYGYVLGMYAFGLEESNEFEHAEEAGWRALEHEARDPWAIHALAHCCEMQGRADEGIRLYAARERHWAENNAFAIHNHWHVALFHLDLGDRTRCLALYDERIRATRSEVVLDLLDASALAFRLELLGLDLGGRWHELADAWQKVEEEGHYAFNDLHALIAYASAGRPAEVERVLSGLARSAEQGGTNALLAREVGLPACRAFAAFAAGDYRRAVDGLFELRLVAARFGGSNAQRDLLEWTLAEAAFRAGELSLARGLWRARAARKPQSRGEALELARVLSTSAPASPGAVA
jgi:hypothetical protein